MSALASGDLFASVGGILTGIAELLGLIGAGIGYIVRSRRNAHRERLRTETAAGLAAQEAKKQLEARLERQHADLIQQYKDQMEDLEKIHTRERENFQRQIKDLNRDREILLSRLLDINKEPKQDG